MLRYLRRDRLGLAYLAVSLAITPLGSCGNGIPGENEPESSFSPLTDEEEDALDRMRFYIDAAEKLDANKRIPEEVRVELRRSIQATRDALTGFIQLRQRGSTRAETMDGIGFAAVGILGDNATGLGVADDVLLIGLGLAAMATWIFTSSPANRDHLGRAWHGVGERLDELGAMVVALGSAAEDLADDILSPAPAPKPSQPRIGDLLDKLPRTPANTNTAKPPAPTPAPTTAGTSIAPMPAPKAKPDPEDERDECKPEPWCPHKGQDTWHHKCADEFVGNVYPGCDAMVNGKRFDALQGRTLYEVKTHKYSTYKEIVKKWVLDEHVASAKLEHRLASDCGFDFRFLVADRELYDALIERLKHTQILVVYEPRCSRDNMP